MQAEIAPVKFFFDDEEPNSKFEFQVADQRHQKDLQTPPMLKNKLMTKNNPTDPYDSHFYALHNKFLAQNKVYILHFQKI